jgi:hypothetical protein
VSDRPEDQGSRPAPVARRPWLGAAWGCVLAAAVALLVGAAGTRAGLWGYPAGSLLASASVWFGFAAILLAGVAMFRSRRVVAALAAVIAAALVIALPVRAWLVARGAAPIADVTTDPDNPPRYVAVARLRNGGANPAAYGGPLVAAAQRAAYPDLRPLIVMAPPRQALALAADTARAEGWTIVAHDLGFGDLGRLEATDASGWFGRTDDIVVRVLPHAAGSRVDVRSSARDDARDGGRNARRVRRFLAYLSERARADPGATR